jgi:hypothetical protein
VGCPAEGKEEVNLGADFVVRHRRRKGLCPGLPAVVLAYLVVVIIILTVMMILLFFLAKYH